MVNAYFWLFSILKVNCFQDFIVILNQSRDVVILQRSDCVPAVISKVIDYDVESFVRSDQKG